MIGYAGYKAIIEFVSIVGSLDTTYSGYKLKKWGSTGKYFSFEHKTDTIIVSMQAPLIFIEHNKALFVINTLGRYSRQTKNSIKTYKVIFAFIKKHHQIRLHEKMRAMLTSETFDK